jgi:putative ABC transport system permease protein
MFKNYFKIALRNLLRNKFYSLLNILGLAIGLTCVILIGLFLKEQLTYDKNYEDYERIYRLGSHFEVQGKPDEFAISSIPIAPVIKDEMPGIVEEMVRFFEPGTNVFKYKEKEFYEDNIVFADSTVFDVFTHNIIAGNKQDALDDPNEIVLSESVANKFFGGENPIGKVLVTGDNINFTVTGVFRDIPANVHYRYDGLMSMATMAKQAGEERFNSRQPMMFWNINNFSYVKLHEGAEISQLMEDFDRVYQKYMAATGERLNMKFDLMAMRLDKIHLNSNLQNDKPVGNINYLYIFAIVALFILLIAAINYMNMATARSSRRAREVGIRKVVGARRHSLHWQFLIESMLVAFLAMILAIVAAELLLPLYNHVAGATYNLKFSQNYVLYGGILVVTVLVGLASGSYPAFYLASFQPLRVLKGELTSGKSSAMMRKILVLVQFTISIIMIIGTLMVSRQLNYVQNKQLGFNKENVVVMRIRDREALSKASVLQDKLEIIPEVKMTTLTDSYPSAEFSKILMKVEVDSEMKEKAVNLHFVQANYTEVMGLKIAKGRTFDENMKTDETEAVLANQAALRHFGWEEPLGKRVFLGVGGAEENIRRMKVIGVLEDYHYDSLHNKIEPMFLFLTSRPLPNVLIRIDGNNISATLQQMQAAWDETLPNYPFKYEFLDENLSRYYEAEQKLGVIFRVFAIICIVIACLGLFGLSAFIAERKTREIGIRKVLGATTANITYILSKQFAIWVIIANFIAWPLAFWGLNFWLKNFSYKISIWNNVWIFVLAGLLALLIALFTVVFQALKAAHTDPANALKYE